MAVTTYIVDKDGNQIDASSATVPANRDFRGAWVLNGSVISEDMDKKEALEFAKELVEELERSLAALQHRRELLDQREQEINEKLSRWQQNIKDLTEEVKPVASLSELDLSKGRLTDACYPILKATGHGLHGKDLVSELKRHGREFKAKNPEDSVNKMLQRDPRFSRPGDRGTYWELSEWRDLLEEVEEPSTK